MVSGSYSAPPSSKRRYRARVVEPANSVELQKVSPLVSGKAAVSSHDLRFGSEIARDLRVLNPLRTRA